MGLLTPEDFEPWVGRKVRVNTVPEPVEVVLDHIETLPRLAGSLDIRLPFSLYFKSALGVYLLDDNYEFDCGKGGPYTIYITQLVPQADARVYQAAFN